MTALETFSLECPEMFCCATGVLEETPDYDTYETCASCEDWADENGSPFWSYVHGLIEDGSIVDRNYTADEAVATAKALLDAAVIRSFTVSDDDDPDEVDRLEVVLTSGHELYIYGPEGGESVVRQTAGDLAGDFNQFWLWSAPAAYYWATLVDGES